VWVTLRSDVPKISSHLSPLDFFVRVDAWMRPPSRNANLPLGGIDLLPVDRSILEKAAALGPTDLRSLDAIHLASALSVKVNLTALVAYDSRL